MTLPADNPIRSAEDDLLSRTDAATSFATQLLALDASEGLVLGVLGPWGAGKTSFVNLARVELERAGVTILDFNPWMFSGAEQLVDSFFVELAAQLRVRPGMAELGKNLEEYGESFAGLAWLPLVGPWIERGRGLNKLLSKLLLRRKEGVSGRRTQLQQRLRKLDRPIVVVIDDIDRLHTNEIRDIFKLVRLTASFPNIVYVLSFDRARVEQALTEQGIPGRDYLEKIIQVTVDLPAVPPEVMYRQIIVALNAALAGIENAGQFDDQTWPDIFAEIVWPLIRTMRDVRRYAAGVQGTVRALEGQIALADVLGIEAVRIFLPDVFAKMPGAVEALTTTSVIGYGGQGDPPRLKLTINGLVDAAGERGEVVRNLIQRLFPAAHRHIGGSHYTTDWMKAWLRERRVAHEHLLRLYLERVASEGFRAFTDAERAFFVITDEQLFKAYLDTLELDRLEDVIAALEAYEEKFPAEAARTAVPVLLNLLPNLPEKQRGMFNLNTRIVVGRVVYRLLKQVPTPTEVEALVNEVLPKLKSLSAKSELITDVGHREGAGHGLVSETAAEQFEATLRAEVRAATTEQLAAEFDLLRLLLVTKREAKPTESALVIPDDPLLTRAILKKARTEVRGNVMGNRAVSVSHRMAWDALVEIFDNEQAVKVRFEAAKTAIPDDDGLYELVEKYLSGWRPPDFGGELGA